MSKVGKEELSLNKIMKLEDIDPEDVKLIRHSLSDEKFSQCFSKGYEYVKEYTGIQLRKFATNAKYWMIFIGDAGTTARYFCTYKVIGKKPLDKADMSEGFPVSEMYDNNECSTFILEETEIMDEYRERLIIEWGRGTIQWAQNAVNDKKVVAISSPQFPGYEKIILSFGRLSEIVNAPNRFSSYHEALKNVKAVYLITDTSTGKLYVGSATGKDGLFGRWSDYVKTKHGGNEGLKVHIENNDKIYENFQYSILQIFSMHTPKEDVIDAETLFKKKLLTLHNEYGLNQN